MEVSGGRGGLRICGRSEGAKSDGVGEVEDAEVVRVEGVVVVALIVGGGHCIGERMGWSVR